MVIDDYHKTAALVTVVVVYLRAVFVVSMTDIDEVRIIAVWTKPFGDSSIRIHQHRHFPFANLPFLANSRIIFVWGMCVTGRISHFEYIWLDRVGIL